MYMVIVMIYQYIIIILILLIVAFAIVKLNKKDISIEMNKLVNYLGGKKNIIDVEVNKSRCKITLNDVSIVNKDAIQKLGARGIVEIDNQLKIILGSEAKVLKKYIDEYILDNKKEQSSKN